MKLPYHSIIEWNLLFVAIGLYVVSTVSASDWDTKNMSLWWMDSRINVHIPFDLYLSSGYDHVKADYGFESQTKGSIHSYVYYIDGTLCDPISPIRHTQSSKVNNNTSNENDDDSLHPAVYPDDNKLDGSTSLRMFRTPFILMVKSDHCSSVVKTRNAQAVGAAALLIAHDHCLCADDQDCINRFGNNKCVEPPINLVNDGSAGDISIPSFLLYKIQSEKIIDQLKNKNKTTLMELTWGLELSSDVLGAKDTTDVPPVMIHLFTTAHNPLINHDEYYAFRVVNKAFTNDQAQFYPNYAVLDGSRYGCDQQDDDTSTSSSQNCSQLCTNHGRYCTIHSSGEVTGYDILKETVRQICIWQHYSSIKAGKIRTSTDVYWDYVRYFRLHCTSIDYTNEECIHDAMMNANIPLDEHHGGIKRSKVIDECMEESADMDSDTRNPLLDYHMERQMEYGIITVPAISVNKHKLENPSAYHLFQSICEYYWKFPVQAKNYPTVCDTCGPCSNLIGCLEQGRCIESSNHHFADDAFHHHHRNRDKNQEVSSLWTIFLATCIFVGGLHYYRRRRELDQMPSSYNISSNGGVSSWNPTRFMMNHLFKPPYEVSNPRDPFINNENQISPSQLLDQELLSD